MSWKFLTCREFAESTEEGRRIEAAYVAAFIDRKQLDARFADLIGKLHANNECNGPSIHGEI